METQEKKIKTLKKANSEGQDRLYLAKCAKTEAEARIKELEVEVKEQNLVSASEIEEDWENLITRCRNKLLGLPSRLSLELSMSTDAQAIKKRLTEVIDEALLELAGKPND